MEGWGGGQEVARGRERADGRAIIGAIVHSKGLDNLLPPPPPPPPAAGPPGSVEVV